MLVIGLTGGIGCGKSTVGKLFSDRGITVIDTDQLARLVTEPGLPAYHAILLAFGKDILLKDQQINRAKLRKLIFVDLQKKKWLEELLHPLIRNALAQHIQSATSPYCIALIPLLLETTPNPLIDRILVVDATEEQQLLRAQTRDQLSSHEIDAILKTQIGRTERLAAADDIIYNYDDLADLDQQVSQFHDLYLSLSLPK